VEKSLVELPVPRMKRIETEYGVTAEQADLICEEKAQADYFETAVMSAAQKGVDKKDAAAKIANWLLSDIKHILHRDGIALNNIGAFKLSAERLATLVVMLSKGQVSGKNAKQALEESIASDRDPDAIIKEKGWELITDPAKIAEFVAAIQSAQASTFAEVKEAVAAGNAKRSATLKAFLVGKVLAASGGRADPQVAGKQIEELIVKL
jgi:aspartyl-tRNA(Asn)/glutamyl-tRNA(Gln) amidotransferase subunit B